MKIVIKTKHYFSIVTSLKTLIFVILFFIVHDSFSQEICNNCIDDDGDGLVDCYDPDCCGQGNCTYSFICTPNNITTACTVDSFPNVSFAAPVLWKNNIEIDTRRTVVAGDIDNDGEVELVVVGSISQGMIIVNGKTGITEQQVPLPYNVSTYFDSPAIGDVDNDGYSEIFLIMNDRVMARYEYDGSSWIASDGLGLWTNVTIGYSNGYGKSWVPSLTDFNYDGIPEVYLGNQIYNSLTGAFIAQAPNGQSDNVGSTKLGGPSDKSAYPSAADVLPDNYCPDCQGLELIAGNEVYSVNISTGKMTLASSIPDNIIVSNNADGPTSIADFDQDGYLDVIVNGAGGVDLCLGPKNSHYFGRRTL